MLIRLFPVVKEIGEELYLVHNKTILDAFHDIGVATRWMRQSEIYLHPSPPPQFSPPLYCRKDVEGFWSALVRECVKGLECKKHEPAQMVGYWLPAGFSRSVPDFASLDIPGYRQLNL